MIVVTGGAGFIGSNIVKALNNRGRSDIVVVDDLVDGVKFLNISDCEIMDYIDKDDFLIRLKEGGEFYGEVEAVFHEGACSSTTEWDGRFMMNNNYEYSKKLLNYCLEQKTSFIYASSASVYGRGEAFEENRKYEEPINVYGYSKFLFDQYIRRTLPSAKSQIAGFRYFNVYGPREQHKGSMSSVAYHFNNSIKNDGKVKLFSGYDGYDDGEQRRDFVYIDDVIDVNLWFLDHQDISGIYNVGTGRSQSFNDVANAVIEYHQRGSIEYVDFPEHLKGCYQSFTQANISLLRHVGYDQEFKSVEDGVREYMEWLEIRGQ